jgi:hypothetical protein
MQSKTGGVSQENLKWDQVLAFLLTKKQELEKMEKNCGERKKKLAVS